MALDPERRKQLHALKLRALIVDHLGWSVGDVTGTEDGAVATARDVDGVTCVAALAEERPRRGLGGALAVAIRRQTDRVHVFAADEAGVLARRATELAAPPKVWRVDGRDATPADAELFGAPTTPPEVPELIALLELADVDVVVEHGIVIGEIQGLEVARVMPSGGGHHVEVGVGAHDREAFGLLHGDLPTPDAIRQVADVVRRHRAPGADPHPLNRLGAERWLRSRLIERPERASAAELTSVEPPVQRTNLKEPVPAVATGRTTEGAPLVLVTAVGIDLDLVPFAADARLRHDPEAVLRIAVPRRDAHSVLHEMAARLARPAEIIAIDDRWREWDSAASVA